MHEYFLNCVVGGGGVEIPKGGRAGKARFLGIWLRGGPDHSGGGGGGEIPGTPEIGLLF